MLYLCFTSFTVTHLFSDARLLSQTCLWDITENIHAPLTDVPVFTRAAPRPALLIQVKGQSISQTENITPRASGTSITKNSCSPLFSPGDIWKEAGMDEVWCAPC